MEELNHDTGTRLVKRGLAEMLKGGVIMDVVDAEQAKIAEDAGATAVMALERVPVELLIRKAPEQWHLMQPNWPSDSQQEKR